MSNATQIKPCDACDGTCTSERECKFLNMPDDPDFDEFDEDEEDEEDEIVIYWCAGCNKDYARKPIWSECPQCGAIIEETIL